MIRQAPHGVCEICGKREEQLRPLMLTDFCGVVCADCREQLTDCMPRRYCGSTEETETAE